MSDSIALQIPRLWRANHAISTDWYGSLRLALIESGYLRSRDPVQIGIRELHGKEVLCRPGTTDAGVLKCTFKQQYHLPAVPLADPSVIVDLGSNVGYTVAHFASKYPKARVLGVEMDRGNYELALQNTSQFGPRCTVVHAAIWDRPGTVSYTTSAGEEGFHVDSTEFNADRQVPALLIQDLFSRFGIEKVDYLKMDIEGAELVVLQSASVWADKVALMQIEVHPPATLESCRSALTPLGFSCTVDTKHWATIIASRQ